MKNHCFPNIILLLRSRWLEQLTWWSSIIRKWLFIHECDMESPSNLYIIFHCIHALHCFSSFNACFSCIFLRIFQVVFMHLLLRLFIRETRSCYTKKKTECDKMEEIKEADHWDYFQSFWTCILHFPRPHCIFKPVLLFSYIRKPIMKCIVTHSWLP